VLEQGWTLTVAAEAAGVSVRCARKWVARYRIEGEQGLFDRSSAPRNGFETAQNCVLQVFPDCSPVGSSLPNGFRRRN
jgi:hypothetical protein